MNGGRYGASPSPPSPSELQAPPLQPSLPAFIASLTSVDVDALRRVFNERLCVDDLRVLGAFAAQPHPLLHAVLACTHCLLLTLSSSHHRQEEQLELQV
uniref:Uncharacterized protein n=1 Tax=Globisporangium ultimum (strain ATCC 200006 / CBS 805.95 / DAOM BR144) TaxID=431595 RepID=K3WKX0_GLOUD